MIAKSLEMYFQGEKSFHQIPLGRAKILAQYRWVENISGLALPSGTDYNNNYNQYRWVEIKYCQYR